MLAEDPNTTWTYLLVEVLYQALTFRELLRSDTRDKWCQSFANTWDGNFQVKNTGHNFFSFHRLHSFSFAGRSVAVRANCTHTAQTFFWKDQLTNPKSVDFKRDVSCNPSCYQVESIVGANSLQNCKHSPAHEPNLRFLPNKAPPPL